MRTAFIEATPRLDVRELGLDQDGDTVVIRIHGQVIPVTRGKCGYTVRPWFRCPDCGKRTARVYRFRERWACRDCHGLMYASQWRAKELRLLRDLEELTKEALAGRPKWQRSRLGSSG